MSSLDERDISQIMEASKHASARFRKQNALYIVATPIGNPLDISLHALEVLKAADAIFCEDTRITGRLLQHYGIKASLFIYNDHSGEKERDHILRRLNDGQSIALVSDAGTPLISDPGYRLIADIQQHNYKMISLPGASSVITALTLAGLPTDRFCFHGFLPSKTSAKRSFLEPLVNWPTTHVFFESAKRIIDTLAVSQHVFGNEREAVVARELTKTYEEYQRLPLKELSEHYQNNPDIRGEIVFMIAPQTLENTLDEHELDKQILAALENMRLKEAVGFVAEHTKINKKQVYERALILSGKK